MKSKSLNSAGIFVSVLCAIHCMIVPIGIALFGLSANNSNHLIFDVFILLFAIGIMFLSLKNEKELLQSQLVISLLVLGTIFYIGYFLVPSPINHFLFIFGSLCWLTTHVLNLRNQST